MLSYTEDMNVAVVHYLTEVYTSCSVGLVLVLRQLIAIVHTKFYYSFISVLMVTVGFKPEAPEH
jgi:hypothetical protein